MAQRTVTVCDLCDAVEARTFKLSVNGDAFTLDLCPSCSAVLEKMRQAAPKSGNNSVASPVFLPPAKPAQPVLEPKVIRTWANENGYKVSPKGKIPEDVLMAYKKAH